MKLYIDTSVWNYLVADDIPQKQKNTIDFFDNQSKAHEIYISTLVLDEISMTRDSVKRQLMERAIEEKAPEPLSISDEMINLAEEIIKTGVVRPVSKADALHLSIAIVSSMDAVVSWNLRDLVKLRTRRLVSALCRAKGYKELDIVTPEEV